MPGWAKAIALRAHPPIYRQARRGYRGRKRLEETLPRCTEADYRMTNGSSLDKLIELGAFVMASEQKIALPSGKQTEPCRWHQRSWLWNR
ncbi:MAG: hypothetical protein ACLT98_02920 [Eggerthellaceae bacterium]